MVFSILKCGISAEGAVLLLLISLEAELDQIGTVLLVKVLKQTHQAQAWSSTSVIMKKQKYFDFSF